MDSDQPVVTRFISVAVPVPGLTALTYRVPPDVELPGRGARVLVPLGSRRVIGCVVAGPVSGPCDATVKDVIAVLDTDPFLPEDVVDLAAWIAEYYACGLGEAIAMAMPPGAARQRTPGGSSFKHVRVAAVTAHGLEAAGVGVALGARQRDAREALKGSPPGLRVSELTSRGFSGTTLSRLAARGLISIRQERIERDPFDRDRDAVSPVAATDRAPTSEQAAAFARLNALAGAGKFGVALVRGVTGSGKTELYLRLAASVRAANRTVLVLVPEIALTPALSAVFREAFGTSVAIQHSGLSAGERHDQWHRIRRGEVGVVVGTRSAVMAPLSSIGLIVVDEEHDASYKQDESPRYHGRDVAIMRAKRESALVVLGSATPSMESYRHALAGRYELVTMERRVFDRPLAGVSIVNMREQYAEGGPDVVLSARLREAMAKRLDRREQVLLLLNRRGYATAIFCRQCGRTLECPNCSVSLIVHRGISRARCHYCNYSRAVPQACVACAAPYLQQAGFGTERIEVEVNEHFPSAKVGRLDRDVARRKGAISDVLESFRRRELEVLVGTQMIAKGHDFPHVTLVGVISADVGLGIADFRAAERTFQLLTQVAGRAGRGSVSGEAIIQTLCPEHYGIRHACRQDYQGFYRDELKFRTAMRYPPVVALINAVVRGPSFEAAMNGATDLAVKVREQLVHPGIRVLGPAPAPLVRLRGEHRAQFFIKADPRYRAEMRRAIVSAVAARPDLRKRVTIDVDPVTVL